MGQKSRQPDRTHGKITRRKFVKKAAAAVAIPQFLPRLSLAQSPNGKMNYAAIGVGGMGWADITEIANTGKVNVVALCDIDEVKLMEAAEKWPNARKYKDWRQLLDHERRHIDSISNSTPDHMHAPISITAMRLGKNVYCQKPLAHNIYETRQLANTAQETGVVTQLGTQIHSWDCYRRTVLILRDLVIGKVKEVHTWASTPGFPTNQPRPPGKDPVPAEIDWDLWIGTAPMRPYKPEIYHPFHWRGWQDFGTAQVGDMGCHLLDPIFGGLRLATPFSARAEVSPNWQADPAIYQESWPDWLIVHYEFAGTDQTADSTLPYTWYDGGKKPPPELTQLLDGQEWPGNGSIVVGEEGVLILPHCQEPQLFPKEKFADYHPPEFDGRNHYGQWVDACLGQSETTAHFGYGGMLTETVLLGTVAMRYAGQQLDWDSASLKVTNVPSANQYLRRNYRDGWHVKGLG